MSRLISFRLPCVACHGTGYAPDPPRTPPPNTDHDSRSVESDAKPVPQFAGLPPGAPMSDEALFRKAIDLIAEASRSGEISEQQAAANLRALERLKDAATQAVSSAADADAQASRSHDVISDQKSLFVRSDREPGGRAHRIPDRAESLLPLLTPLKSFLVDETNRVRQGRAEKERGLALLLELARAQKALSEAADNGQVRRIEHFQLRSLAWSIRKFALRRHLMVAQPFWGASSVEPDATCVFFAGGDAVRGDMVRYCEKRGLTLKHAPEGGASGHLRWDLIRESVAGVFDLTVSSQRTRASVCHALGISLALGRYPLILAKAGASLPFDIDVEAEYLTPAQASSGIVAKRLDEALFRLHPTGGESSLAATGRQVPGTPHSSDDVELQQQLEHRLSGSGHAAPRVLLHPVWPASYPDVKCPTAFHLMPFGKKWSGPVRDKVRRAIEHGGLEYRRGDQTKGVYVIRAIWDEICRASMVIADLTGLNENVCLELGMAQAIGRPALLMTQDDIGRSRFPEIAKLRLSSGRRGREARRAPHQRRSPHLAVRLAVREAVLHPGRRRHDGDRMGRAGGRSRTECRPSQPELDCRRADSGWRRIRNGAEHYASRSRTGPGDRHDVSGRRAEHSGECRRGSLEGRNARERAVRVQPAAPVRNGRDNLGRAISAFLDQLATGDAMSVRCSKTKFPKSPGLVRRFGCHQGSSRGQFSIELIHAVDIPVHEVRMVSQRACRFRVRALAQHHPETVTRQKAPSLGIDRIPAEAKDVGVVPR